MYFNIRAICLLLILNIFTCYTQTRLSGQWSLMLNGNINGNIGASEAMNGSADEFMKDAAIDYNTSKYPFGDNATRTFNLGGMLSYKFNESPVSLNMGMNIYMFSLVSSTFFLDKAYMGIVSYTPSIEYSIGEPSEIWNIFGRAGVNFNIILGNVTYFTNKTTVTPAFRIGAEIEAGGRLNIPSTPIALEVSATFLNINLIGKSYKEFNEKPPQDLKERELNDGKNPNNPDDKDRNISFLSLRGGIRIWF